MAEAPFTPGSIVEAAGKAAPVVGGSSKWRFIVGVSAVVLPAAVRLFANWRTLNRGLLMLQLNRNLKKVQKKRAQLLTEGKQPKHVSPELEALEKLFRSLPLSPDINTTRSFMRGFPVFAKEERYIEELINIFPASPTVLRPCIPACWVHPANMPKHNPYKRVIMYLHGGGYVAGRAQDYIHVGARIARLTQSRVLLVDYCLCPEWIIPPEQGRFAPVEESVTAYRYLLDSGELPENVILAGDSAGGGLTMLTLLRIREQNLPLPRAAVMLSPWLDLTLSLDSWKVLKHVDFMLGIAEPVVGPQREPVQALITGSRDPKVWASPVYSPLFAASFAGLPSLYILVGGAEVLVDEATQLAETARRQGVEVALKIAPGMCHIFPLFSDWVPEGRAAMEEIARWIDMQFSTVPQSMVGATLRTSLSSSFRSK